MMKKISMALLCAIFVSNATFAEVKPDEIKQVITRTDALMNAYSNYLRPAQDPFARIFALEPATALFFRMKMRIIKRGETTQSPLGKILNAFVGYKHGESHYDANLVQEILRDADSVLATQSFKTFKKIDWQSNLLTLQYLADYLRRFAPVSESDEQNPTDNKAKNDKEEASKEKSKEKKPPEHPELGKKYKPHTKDTEKEAGSKDDQVVVLEVNFETPLFGQRYFSEIVRGAPSPFAEIDLPMATFSISKRTRNTGKELVVRTFGKTRVALFLPPEHRPLQPTDPRAVIVREKSGNYVLEIEPQNIAAMSEVTIPLEQGSSEKLGPQVLEVFKRPVGFDLAEWPSSVQLGIFSQFPPYDARNLDAAKVAQQVADHIATSYLYSVGARPETDPVEALKTGAFQCDMAAYAMVSILRDAYDIPSRVVVGFRAKKFRKGEDKKSYLVLPGEAHAWVEVYIDGEWKVFDPTPIKKDRKDKKDDKDGEKDEYSDRPLENTPKPPPEEDADGTPGDESGEEEKQSAKERLKKDTEERLKQNGHNATDPKTHCNSTKEDDIIIMDSEELANLLEIGSLEMEPKPDTNPLLNRAYRVLLRIVLDPNNDSKTIHTGISAMGGIFRSLGSDVRSLFIEAQATHESSHKALAPWLSNISARYKELEVPEIYKELYFAKKALELYVRTLDAKGDIHIPAELLSSLKDALDEVSKLAHHDSPRISMVDGFHRALPGLVQSLLAEDYGLSKVGDNAPTRLVAKELEKGSLNPLRLLSDLTPVSDFILDSVPRPEYEEVRTWSRDTQKTVGFELMPLQRYSEMARGLALQPWATLAQNIRDGTLFVPVRKQRVNIPTGFGKDDSERITIVAYDVSGSMSGTPEEFQAALIAAFTARALGDVSPSGRNRHKVVLLPFEGQVGTPTKITTSQEAIALIRNFKAKLTGGGGGTDIQGAMIQALALIADAEKRAGEPLAAANIILMTDGEAEVDINKLAEARNAIDRETPIQTMFVAIGNSNEQLVKFAMDSRRAGFEPGFYREFTTAHMEDLINASKGPLKDRSAGQIYSAYDASGLSFKFDQAISRAAVLAQEFAQDVRSASRFEKAESHYQRIPWRNHVDTGVDKSDLDGWLQGVRRFAFNNVFTHKELQDRHLLERVVDDLMKHFAFLTKKEIHELSLREESHLHHLLSRAAGKNLGERGAH